MGASSSMCSGRSSDVDPWAHSRPRVQNRETQGLLSSRPPPPPYSRNYPPPNRGGFTGGNGNGYDNYPSSGSGYPQPPLSGVIKPNELPPPYESPLRHPGSTASGTVTAVTASPSVVNDPGDLWLYSELPPSSIEEDDEVFDNGDDVEDFETPPDGHLVFTSLNDYKIFYDDFASRTSGKLFEDPDFRADRESIFGSESGDGADIRWLRPHELRPEPRLIVDGISRQDVVQGNLGDCWFLASLSALAKMPAIMEKVIPAEQGFSVGYTGMFHFRFWRFGRWVRVVIDDRLPTRQGQLVFAHSSDPDEFWPSLVEKAYAKLHGSYSGLAGGMSADAFVDLTGGLAEVYELSTHNPDDMYGLLYRGTRSGAFVCCSRKGNWRANETNNLGIVTGHSYSVHRVHIGLQKGGTKEKLVQIRNPWANSTEWKGRWSDTSELWSRLQNLDDFKEEGVTTATDDGTFWMSYKDFLSEFTKVVISTVGPDFDGDGVPDVVNNTARGFHLVTRSGRWRKGVNAGGCMNNQAGFHTNPQIMITLLEPDEWTPDRGTPSENRGKCALIVTLLQEYRRLRNKRRTKKQQIGFRLYKVSDTERPMSKDDTLYSRAVAISGTFINHREVFVRLVLEPGHYCVIPSTFDANVSLRFMVRVFTEKPIICTALQTG